MFNRNQSLDEMKLIHFENVIGFRLPSDYRSFLSSCNGGWFEGEYPEISAETIGTVCVDSLFGIGLTRALDIEFWYQEMNRDIPGLSLVIGKDPSVLAKAAGVNLPPGTQLLFAETDANHPFVVEEQMMPFVPVVPILAALSCLWLMLNLEVETWLRFLIWMAIGVVLYFVYGRSHSMMGRPRPEAHKHLNVTQLAA